MEPKNQGEIKAIFTDIGGVLLTNGWDHKARERACDTFHLDYGDMNERHHLTFDTYEEGKLSLDEYLTRLVFFKERPFSREDFKAFMFDQSQPFPDMIELMRSLKERHNLKVTAISNEGRELTIYRIQHFGLESLIDTFIASSFVHYRKPDADIFNLAIDVSQVPSSQAVYIDDRCLFVEVARGLGIPSFQHVSLESTRAELASMGIS